MIMYICVQSYFLVIRKKIFPETITNYQIVHRKNHVQYNNDLTFQPVTVALASIILSNHIQTLNVSTKASKMSGKSFPFVNQNKEAAKLPG